MVRKAAMRGTHVLHVERVESQAPQSPHARNEEFEALAEEHEVGCSTAWMWDLSRGA